MNCSKVLCSNDTVSGVDSAWGFGKVDSICTNNSAQVTKSRGFRSIKTLAHELAHAYIFINEQKLFICS